MEQASMLSNPAVRFTVGAVGIWFALTLLFICVAVVYYSKANAQAQPAPIPTNDFVFVSEFEVIGANLSPTAGNGLIKLGGFHIPVKFTFDTDPVSITNLEIGNITDVYGKGYNDFTNFEDHKAINSALVAYINKRREGAVL